jgi:hypothetical protein
VEFAWWNPVLATLEVTLKSRRGDWKVLNANIIIASQAVIWLIAASLLVIAPKTMISFFGSSYTPFTVTLARIFGAELTGLALAGWITRNPSESSTLRGLALSYLICNSLGFIVSLLGWSSGSLQTSAWLLISLYLLYALLFAYLRFAVLVRIDESLK